jgi:hypothetical protein
VVAGRCRVGRRRDVGHGRVAVIVIVVVVVTVTIIVIVVAGSIGCSHAVLHLHLCHCTIDAARDKAGKELVGVAAHELVAVSIDAISKVVVVAVVGI